MRRLQCYRPLLCTVVKGTIGPRATFPFVGSELNSVSAHPHCSHFARRGMSVERPIITNSVLVGQYAGAGDYDQPLRVDYGNNTLVWPKPDYLTQPLSTSQQRDLAARYGTRPSTTCFRSPARACQILRLRVCR